MLVPSLLDCIAPVFVDMPAPGAPSVSREGSGASVFAAVLAEETDETAVEQEPKTSEDKGDEALAVAVPVWVWPSAAPVAAPVVAEPGPMEFNADRSAEDVPAAFGRSIVGESGEAVEEAVKVGLQESAAAKAWAAQIPAGGTPMIHAPEADAPEAHAGGIAVAAVAAVVPEAVVPQRAVAAAWLATPEPQQGIDTTAPSRVDVRDTPMPAEPAKPALETIDTGQTVERDEPPAATDNTAAQWHPLPQGEARQQAFVPVVKDSEGSKEARSPVRAETASATVEAPPPVEPEIVAFSGQMRRTEHQEPDAPFEPEARPPQQHAQQVFSRPAASVGEVAPARLNTRPVEAAAPAAPVRPIETPEAPRGPVQQIHVRVTTPEDGTVSLRFKQSDRGAVDVGVRASNPQTAEALRVELPQLTERLQREGLQTDFRVPAGAQARVTLAADPLVFASSATAATPVHSAGEMRNETRSGGDMPDSPSPDLQDRDGQQGRRNKQDHEEQDDE